MRQFLTVFKFELISYFKNKAYLITTFVICALAIVGLSIPRFISLFDTNDAKDANEITSTYAIYDRDQQIAKSTTLKAFFPKAKFKEVTSEKELKKLIEQEKCTAGFIVNSYHDYKYVVNNTSMMNQDKALFDQAMSQNYQWNEYTSKGYDAQEVLKISNQIIQSSDVVLGKDGVSNYTYTYILIFVIYMMVLMYGQLVASNVASEKSNRAVEILVTSTSSDSLIFGKVLATATAGVIQVLMIWASAAFMYQINVESWNHMLDMVFNIPTAVIASFAVFGILGYLFYSFIFGALGSLVSKVEDINSSSTPIQIIFIAAFFVTFYGMNDIDGILIKVASFIPFSSFMAMFVRISMGSVSTIEVALSLAILAASTVAVGYAAAKIYRRGTLMYGNSIKFKHALKFIRKKD
ncbi:MAG: ABC transporter permease [Erysipelotrichaceae bacterium]